MWACAVFACLLSPGGWSGRIRACLALDPLPAVLALWPGQITPHLWLFSFFFSIQNVFHWDDSLLIWLQGASPWRLIEDHKAANTCTERLCLANESGDVIASWAFHTHEVFTPATSCVFSSPLLERDEGDPLQEARSPEEVFTNRKADRILTYKGDEVTRPLLTCYYLYVRIK